MTRDIRINEEEKIILEMTRVVREQGILNQAQYTNLLLLLQDHEQNPNALFSNILLESLVVLFKAIQEQIPALRNSYDCWQRLNYSPTYVFTAVVAFGLIIGLVATAIAGHSSETSLEKFVAVMIWSGIAGGFLFYKTLNSHKHLSQYIDIHNRLLLVLSKQESMIWQGRRERLPRNVVDYKFGLSIFPSRMEPPAPPLPYFSAMDASRSEVIPPAIQNPPPALPAEGPPPMNLPLDELRQPLLLPEDLLPENVQRQDQFNLPSIELVQFEEKKPALPEQKILSLAPDSPLSPRRGNRLPTDSDDTKHENLASEIKILLKLEKLTPQEVETYQKELNQCQKMSGAAKQQAALKELWTVVSNRIIQQMEQQNLSVSP